MADDWKYDVEDFDDPEEDGDKTPTVSNGTGPESADQATDVFGETGATDIEPGSPSLENTVFVCLGVAVALVVILGV